jgi:hypothetical protein
MAQKSILLMWDYSAYPIWTDCGVNPGSVPISTELRAEIEQWATEMESLMAPAVSKPKWEPPPELADLSIRLVGLAQRAHRELGDDWVVTYHDELTGQRRQVEASRPSVTRRHHHR